MGLVIIREGEGEQEALPSLVGRLRAHLDLGLLPHPSEKRSWRKPLVSRGHVERVCEQVRSFGSCDALLLTRDADNTNLAYEDCPKQTAPPLAERVRGLDLPFPVGVVLFYKEYETLFLAGARGMAGQPVKDRGKVIATIPTTAATHPDPEHPRDAKKWVRRHLLPGYKPALHQLALTKILDLEALADSQLSSYRRLVSALRFLAANVGMAGAVYPRRREVAADDG